MSPENKHLANFSDFHQTRQEIILYHRGILNLVIMIFLVVIFFTAISSFNDILTMTLESKIRKSRLLFPLAKNTILQVLILLFERLCMSASSNM